MKLLYIVPSTEREGGLAKSVNRVVKELRLRSHEVSVFSTGMSETKVNLLNTKDIFTGVQMMETTEKAISMIKSIQPDLVIGYYGSSAAYCAVAAARFCGIKAVACLRGSDINRDFFSVLSAPKLSFVMQFADAVTCVSNEMKQKVSAWYGRDAHFISNGVNKSIFYRDKEAAQLLKKEWNLDERPVVGLFGEFKNSRGLALLDALKDELSPAQTIMVGEIRNEAKHAVPEWITSVPYIHDPGQLRAAYSLCDIVLHPSLYDGMPNVVLEAMACGCAVIASDAGGIKDAIQHEKNGYICTSIEEWKSAITSSLRNGTGGVGEQASESVLSAAQEAVAFEALFLELVYNSKKI